MGHQRLLCVAAMKNFIAMFQIFRHLLLRLPPCCHVAWAKTQREKICMVYLSMICGKNRNPDRQEHERCKKVLLRVWIYIYATSSFNSPLFCQGETVLTLWLKALRFPLHSAGNHVANFQYIKNQQAQIWLSS